MDPSVVEEAFEGFPSIKGIANGLGEFLFFRMRIPVKSAADSETKPATYSDFIPATILI